MKKVLSSNLHQIGYIEKRHLGNCDIDDVMFWKVTILSLNVFLQIVMFTIFLSLDTWHSFDPVFTRVSFPRLRLINQLNSESLVRISTNIVYVTAAMF